MQAQMMLRCIQPLSGAAHHQIGSGNGLAQAGMAAGHLQHIPGMRGHSQAIVLYPAGIDHHQIMKAEVLHGPGHGTHISLVKGLDQNHPKMHRPS